MTDLTLIKQKVFSGKAALEQQQIDDLVKEFDNQIKNFIKIEHLNDETLLDWVELLQGVVESRLVYDFTSQIDVKNYYALGEHLIKLIKAGVESPSSEKLAHEYLNVIRYSNFLKRIANDKKWVSLLDNLIQTGNYSLRNLFKQRVRDYNDATLFNIIKNSKVNTLSWAAIDEKVEHYSDALFSRLDEYPAADVHVAFLLENSPDMAMLDLACLTNGIVNVMIPANSVPQHIKLILNETKVPLLILSDEKQLSKIKEIKNELTELKTVIILQGTSAESWVISFKEFLGFVTESGRKMGEEFRGKILSKSLATIMYTSGTTGEPKGIMFNHLSIVYKRFCRALALPEIGENDRFLAYLPLYHTFGRYLELVGSVFWAAQYSFMEDPSPHTMISNMKSVKPTIFISIPKKWLQLFEHVSLRVDIEMDEVDDIRAEVESLTGGSLKWGLSAAGFLPPDVFMFFQKNGIELMSGFGMTEATGGITMTRPGKYRMNSLGSALPGIDIKVADDGELLIKGSYVMMGYYRQPDEEVFKDGWFPTGDIMRMDNDGYIEIIDRKKEIYKNVKGETVAPQKIENFFRDFENIHQVFLVGDHRPFNTLLIFPEYDIENSVLNKMDHKQMREYFATLIVTVNNFLAPYERIVDFRIIDRAFSADKGELTPKGTYKRRQIEKNFDSIIEEMYTKNFTEVIVKDSEVRIPNWFLREHGLLSSDVYAENSKIIIPKIEKELIVEKIEDEDSLYRVGSYVYSVEDKYINFQNILIDPELWFGNSQLFAFTGDAIVRWQRQYSSSGSIKYNSVAENPVVDQDDLNKLIKILNSGEHSLIGLHIASVILQSEDQDNWEYSRKFISAALPDDESSVRKFVIELLKRANITQSVDLKRELFKIIINDCEPEDFYECSRIYIDDRSDLIDESIINCIVKSSKKPDKLDALLSLLDETALKIKSDKDINNSPVKSLFDLVSQYGIQHPSSYEKIRQVFVTIQLKENIPELANYASLSRTKLRHGFRMWLGQNEYVSVDMETGEEYSWDDVIIFEENIPEEDKKNLSNCIINTPILREAVFLFSKGKIIHLNNLLPGGVWISHHRSYHNKSVYRVTIQTRFQGSFDIVLNLNKNREEQHILDEINLLILASQEQYSQELVENFGGYWDEHGIWSGNFVPGESVAKFLQRESKRIDERNEIRLKNLWPFFVWNAAAAYVNFWKLAGHRFVLADPSINNFIIPSHDYQSGTKVISLSEKQQYNSLVDLFNNFYDNFIQAAEKNYEFLKGKAIWSFVFAGIINAEGEDNGLDILQKYLQELESSENSDKYTEVIAQLKSFMETVRIGDYIPKRLYFAIKRFLRWYELNNDADFKAQAQMLNEMYDTYRLDEIEETYPECRTRLFTETVFSESSIDLKNVLRDIMEKYHTNIISKDEEVSLLTKIPTEFKLSNKEKFFITRLSFPHIKPMDSARLIEYRIDGKSAANLVVESTDYDGEAFFIRNPISPKEISRLHQLFIEANLLVTFRNEHQFLLAISERGFIIGGLFYLRKSDVEAHMEKIVVSNRYRRKGISDRLMNEFFKRMKFENVQNVTTGFFRPEYFYKFGFKVGRKYSGLVKNLQD